MAKKKKEKKEEKKNLPAEISEFEKKRKEYEDIVDLCIKAIKKYKILFISDLVTFLPISRATFYNYKLDKLDSIKDAIDDNKIMMKQALRARWFENPAPALQIALYKMICTEEERNAISNNPQPAKLEEQNKNSESEISFISALEGKAVDVWNDYKST